MGPKEEPKEEESPFGAIKLKKAERVQRTWDDAGLETVELKHHEFERPPQDPTSEGKSTVKLGKALECDIDDKEEKPKKKKKKQKKDEEPEEEEEMEEEPTKSKSPIAKDEEFMKHPDLQNSTQKPKSKDITSDKTETDEQHTKSPIAK